MSSLASSIKAHSRQGHRKSANNSPAETNVTRNTRASATSTRKAKKPKTITKPSRNRPSHSEIQAAPNDPALASDRRSASRERSTPRERTRQQKDEPSKRRSGSLPKRTKYNEKKSTIGRRESDGAKLTKKKGPIRKTRSFENITTNSKKTRENRNLLAAAKGESNRSFSNLTRLVDERGLPLTSIGCAPVASLRTSSPNSVDTNNFDAIYARKLQQEECAKARRRPRLEKRSSSVRSISSTRSLEDCKIPAAEDDRKLPAKRKSKSSKRASRKENAAHHLVVPLNPEESILYHRRNFSREAKSFVQRLRALMEIFAGVGPSQSTLHMQKEPIFTAVLADEDLQGLVRHMLQTQSKFRERGKPQNLDIGYHFCRGNNAKRFQQQPGLWSKIQTSCRGINRSQDGDGIYTFDNPQSTSKIVSAANSSNVDDVWMVVARLRGTQSMATSSQRQWQGDTDALVRPENDVVVLKASTQFFPLVQFRSALLAGGKAGSPRRKTACIDIMKPLQLMQDKLQMLLDDSFNACSPRSAGSKKAELSPRRGVAAKQPKPSAVDGTQTLHRALSCREEVEAVPIPSAWQVASEVKAVIEEHASEAKGVEEGFGKPAFDVQPAVADDESLHLVENMFRTRSRFKACKKPVYIDIGYHYCRGHNLKKMQQKPGFWSNIQAIQYSKSEDGDGIYTFDDPLGTRNRGNRGGFFDMRSISKDDDVWLLVARLQGNRQASAPSSADSPSTGRKWNENVDALTVSGRQSDGVIILRTSAQFFPVLQFPASSVDSTSGTDQDETLEALQLLHQRLQAVFDHFFNDEGLDNCEHDANSLRLERTGEDVLDYCAPNTLETINSINCDSQQIYKVLFERKAASDDDCPICLDSLRWTSHQQVVRLRNCGHEFHRTCLHDALQHFDLCPICNQELTPPVPQSCLQGLSPSGVMVATTAPHTFCRGCWGPGGSLVLSFFFPAGFQKAYHEAPTTAFSSSKCKAYLPNNDQGLRLLRRLQYAFLHGLLFTVKSVGQLEGNTARASIPLKTRPCPTDLVDDNTEAFPDPTYFDRCNQELNRCGVRDSVCCHEFVRRELEAGKSNDQPGASLPAKNPQQRLSQQKSGECARVLKGLQKHQHGWMFCKALPALDGKVEKSMDFTVIESKLSHQEYSCVEDFVRDVTLTFNNAMACHSKENPVHFMAKQLKKKFKKDLRQLECS